MHLVHHVPYDGFKLKQAFALLLLFFLSLRCGVRKCCCHQICLKPQQMNNQLFGREKRSIQS